MGLIQAPERHGHLILRGPSPHFKLSELYSWKLRLCPSSFLPLQTMLRWICLFTSLMQLFKRIFSEITPRGSWVRGFRMTDMPDSPACAPEWLQLCKLSVVEDSQISYISQQLTSRSFLVFYQSDGFKGMAQCYFMLNFSKYKWLWASQPLNFFLHWIAYTSAQPIFYCGFFWCDFDSFAVLSMIPLLMFDCTHLPVYHFVVINFVHSVLSWTEILIFYLIKPITVSLCQCFGAYS